MDNFIEFKTLDDDLVFVNINHILWVSTEKDFRGSYTIIECVQGRFGTNESYEKIKKKIENVGKTFITDGIYVRGSE